MTDLKLGILLWNQESSWPDMLAAAKKVDELGYEHLWAWDHINAIFGDWDQPIFEGWSVLDAWAMATKRTRLGLLVGARLQHHADAGTVVGGVGEDASIIVGLGRKRTGGTEGDCSEGGEGPRQTGKHGIGLRVSR